MAVASAPVTLRTPLLTTPPLVLAAYLATHSTLGLRLTWHGVLAEVVMQTALGVALACVARWRLPFVLSQAILVGLACVAPQLHAVVYGRPLMPDDVHSVRDLLGVLPLGKKLLLVTPVLLLVAGVVGNLAVRRRRAAVAVLVLLALGTAAQVVPEPFFAPLDRAVGGLDQHDSRHFRARGPTTVPWQTSGPVCWSSDASCRSALR